MAELEERRKSFQVETPVGTKAIRLGKAWNFQRETFSVVGMGISGGKNVGGDANNEGYNP